MVESKFQTSFIPKKSLESRPAGGGRRPAGLFRLFAILILLVALAVWGGVYLWKLYLNNKIQGAEQSLAASQKEFELGTVSTLTRLDTRLSASSNLMNNHLAISKIFAELQNITLKSVRFNDFSLSYGGPDKGLVLTMKGQAQSYASVAKQSDIFSQDHNFRSPIFSNLDLDTNGQIVFTVTTGLDQRNFVYGQSVNQ
jgi:hypothetical protein